MGIPRAINVGGWENTRGPGCAGFVLPTLLSARKALLVSNLVVGRHGGQACQRSVWRQASLPADGSSGQWQAGTPALRSTAGRFPTAQNRPIDRTTAVG